MSVTASRLLREEKQRSSARVAALSLAAAEETKLKSQLLRGLRPADEATFNALLAASETAGAAHALRRLRAELRATSHVEHALTWLRGPKCVASSSPIDRIRATLRESFCGKCWSGPTGKAYYCEKCPDSPVCKAGS